MVETSGWLTNVPYRTAILYATIRFDVRRHVFASRDFKENEKIGKKCISSNRQGQRSNSRSRSNKGQGHLEIFTILYVIDVIWLIYEKWKSASKIVNVQPIRPKFDTHNAWTYPMECAKNWTDPKTVTYVSMVTKIPIIKHREFLHISMCYISAIYEHIRFKIYTSHAGEQMANSQNQMTLKCQGQGQTYREP